MVNIERKNLKKRKSKGSHIKRYGIDFYVSKITQAGDTQPPAEVVPEYARLSSRSDVVQSSVRGYCRDVCGMTASRMMRIFGLKAESTYEEWYVDYLSRIAMLATRARLERCHKLLQSAPKYVLQQNLRFVLQCFYKRRKTKETWADCPSFFFQIKSRRNGKFFS